MSGNQEAAFSTFGLNLTGGLFKDLALLFPAARTFSVMRGSASGRRSTKEVADSEKLSKLI